MFTLGTAAKEVGKGKATISKAIASGRLSATRNDKGHYEIQPAELFRVYPPNSAETVEAERQETPGKPAVDTPNTATLQVEIDGLKVRLELMRESIDDLKGQREGWQKQAEAAQRLLADNRPKRRWFGLRAG